MPFIGNLPSVGPNQKQTLGIDFGDFLPGGTTLTGTPTATLTISFGADPNPQSRISGGPDVGTIPVSLGGTGAADAAVILQIYQCVSGTSYVLDVYCNRSDGDIVEATTRFTCDGPG